MTDTMQIAAHKLDANHLGGLVEIETYIDDKFNLTSAIRGPLVKVQQVAKETEVNGVATVKGRTTVWLRTPGKVTKVRIPIDAKVTVTAPPRGWH